jgi:hypothetical protein
VQVSGHGDDDLTGSIGAANPGMSNYRSSSPAFTIPAELLKLSDSTIKAPMR